MTLRGNMTSSRGTVLPPCRRRRRRRALGELLDRLAATDGPLSTVEDEAEIARFMRRPPTGPGCRHCHVDPR
jgi:hypothetical protein